MQKRLNRTKCFGRLKLAEVVSSRCGIPIKDAKLAVEAMIDGMTEALARGQLVMFYDFGRFEIEVRKGKFGRSGFAPVGRGGRGGKGVPVWIPMRAQVRFKTCKKLADCVAKLTHGPTA